MHRTGTYLSILAVSILAYAGTAVAGPQEPLIAPGTPTEAAHSHMRALMTRDPGEIGKTLFFPFVHIQPNGRKFLLQSIEEFPSEGVPYYSEIIAVEELAVVRDQAVVSVRLQVHDMDRNPIRKSSAIWGLIRQDGAWLVSWRQLLGPVDE